MADFTFFLSLPPKTEILVKEGESISKGQKVATYQRLKKHRLDLAKKLKVPPSRVSRYLLVKLGQKIKQEELIAAIKTLLKKISITAPVTGQILAFDNNTGKLTIEVSGKSRNLLAPFSGIIEEIGQEGITVKLTTEKIFDLKECQGKDIFGQLAYHSGNLTSFDCQYQQQIVLVDYLSPALANKAWAINSLAIITHDKINSVKTNLSLAQITPKQAIGLKNFIGQPVIIDTRQKKLAILKNET